MAHKFFCMRNHFLLHVVQDRNINFVAVLLTSFLLRDQSGFYEIAWSSVDLLYLPGLRQMMSMYCHSRLCTWKTTSVMSNNNKYIPG